MSLSRAGLMWLPFILLAAAGAWAFMDNLTSARSRVAEQLAVTKNKHTWVMSFLYIGTFGSFVGYSAALPLLLKTQFPEWGTNIAFVGALVGSVARPIGGKLSDKLGGARVTYWNFIVMAAATGGVAYGLRVHSLAAFLGSFLLLFVTTGVGNGSTFRMIPSIFRAEAMRDAGSDPASQQKAIARGKRESAAVIGISAAIGALGGYFIPQTFSASIKATGGAQSALTAFLAFYAVCLLTTWWFYTRKTFLVAQAPSLAEAEV
jgi:NNP family nitrate/nitrite transporter-like MFS transporter